jgi:hypothetical protein
VYKVLASTRTDMNEGWVWLSNRSYAPRSIIKIKNKSNGAVVYCEALEIDDNFTQEYNQPPRCNIDPADKTIIMNGWYRKRLGGIATKKSHDLEVSEANGFRGRFRASTEHPQVVVRLATWLGVISVALGIVGIGLAFK